jgi:hypothetical protein
MDLAELAKLHREMSPNIARWPVEELLLWYADLGVEVGERVGYHCPGCGTSLSTSLDEFIHRDSSEDLKCDACRGDVEERRGPMD